MARKKAAPPSEIGGQMDLSSLWATESQRFRASRLRIREAGRWRRNEVLPTVPWDDPAPFRVMLPHATTMGASVAAFLARRRPNVHREPLGSDPRAERISSKIEAWLQPILEDQLKANGEPLWDANLAHAVHDGEWAVLVQPDCSHWDDLLSYTDDDDRINPRFQRDAKGRAADDPFYSNAPGRTFAVSKDQSAKAHAAYTRDGKARELPFVVRLIPADQCVPLGIDPEDGSVDALLIRSDRTALSLKKDGFTFVITGPGVNQVTYGAQTALAGAGTLFSLYELHIADEDGYKIFYQVGSSNGRDAFYTTRDGIDATLDMAAKYPGFFKEVPGGYFFGSHFANETNPDRKGYPYITVFLSLLRGLNQTLSAKVAHMYLTAFGGWNARLSAEDVSTWTELGKPVDIEVKPGRVNYVVGELSPAVHPGTGRDVDSFIEMALAVLREIGPAGDTPSSDQSGFAQGVSIASSDAAFGQMTRGAQQAMRCIARCLLEQCAAISIETGAPVPVYAHQDPKAKTRQDHVELEASDLDGDFDVDVLLPTPKFSNLALMQAGAGFVQQGLIPQREWLESMAGYENPEHIQDLQWVEAQMKSPEGQQYVLQLAAQFSGEAGLQKIQKLAAAGKTGAGGTPSAALPGRPGPDPNAPGGTGIDAPTGPNTGNPAQAAVSGLMQTVSQTAPQSNVIAATGGSAPVAQ